MSEMIKVQTVARGYLLNYQIRQPDQTNITGPEIYEKRDEMIDRLNQLLDIAEAPRAPLKEMSNG